MAVLDRDAKRGTPPVLTSYEVATRSEQIKDILVNLAQANGLKVIPDFEISDDPKANIYTATNGNIVITAGLLKKLPVERDRSSGLAFALARELYQKHDANKQVREDLGISVRFASSKYRGGQKELRGVATMLQRAGYDVKQGWQYARMLDNSYDPQEKDQVRSAIHPLGLGSPNMENVNVYGAPMRFSDYYPQKISDRFGLSVGVPLGSGRTFENPRAQSRSFFRSQASWENKMVLAPFIFADVKAGQNFGLSVTPLESGKAKLATRLKAVAFGSTVNGILGSAHSVAAADRNLDILFSCTDRRVVDAFLEPAKFKLTREEKLALQKDLRSRSQTELYFGSDRFGLNTKRTGIGQGAENEVKGLYAREQGDRNKEVEIPLWMALDSRTALYEAFAKGGISREVAQNFCQMTEKQAVDLCEESRRRAMMSGDIRVASKAMFSTQHVTEQTAENTIQQGIDQYRAQQEKERVEREQQRKAQVVSAVRYMIGKMIEARMFRRATMRAAATSMALARTARMPVRTIDQAKTMATGLANKAVTVTQDLAKQPQNLALARNSEKLAAGLSNSTQQMIANVDLKQPGAFKKLTTAVDQDILRTAAQELGRAVESVAKNRGQEQNIGQEKSRSLNTPKRGQEMARSASVRRGREGVSIG